jgi:hypothetical protein
MRRAIYLASFALGCVATIGCGATNAVELDHSSIWSGGTNQVQSGGYWFSYVDHISWMAAHPNLNPAGHTADQGASLTPLTDMNTPMPIVPDPDGTSGHGDTVHVSGKTPAVADWNDVATNGNWFDTYYQQPNLYPTSLNGAFPVAGVGFGFLPHSAPGFDPTQGGKYVGFVFDMKTQQSTRDVDVQLALVCSATDGNDLNDENVEDAFAKPGCTFAKAQAQGETLTQQATDFSSGPTSYFYQTCFLYQHKMVVPIADNQWGTYCVLWNEMGLPDWHKAQAQPPVWSDENLKTCTTKLKWEMHKPAAGEQPSPFEVYLDNVKLITRVEAASHGCAMNALPADTSRAIGPITAADTAP